MKKFLKILFSFIGTAYLLTFVYSFIKNNQAASAYDVGRAVGYDLGFVSYYLLIIALVSFALFFVNMLVNKFKYSG